MLPISICRTRSLATLGTARAFAAAQELWATQLRVKDKGKFIFVLSIPAPRPAKPQQTLEVEFNTGEHFSLPAEYLRAESPAAGNLDARDAFGRLKVVHGRRHVSILDVEPVGSYAVRLSFDDLHNQGIFPWPLLRDLGSHKLSRMRRYLRLLKQRGLSRDPPALLHRRQQGSSGCGAMQQQQQQQQQQRGAGASSNGQGVAGGGGGSSCAAGSRAAGSSGGSAREGGLTITGGGDTGEGHSSGRSIAGRMGKLLGGSSGTSSSNSTDSAG
ncbi:hypothetical protein ABPG77_010025 [Micractinium sp. CCAP 211/92]